MNLYGIMTIVSKISPILGTALGSPIGGMIVSLIANKFGLDPNNHQAIIDTLTNSPDAAVKIKEIENAHTEELEHISQSEYQSQIQDVEDARHTNSQDKNRIVHIIAIIYSLGFFLYVFVFVFYPNDGDKGLFHDLLNVVMLILGYYYGTSHRENSK
jgi:hypothetical protein